jgi:hypothetical protein
MTDGRKRAFGLESADVGLGLRPKNIGARVKRVEDRRLLTGRGAFTDDRIVPDALHVAFRRSDHAHSGCSGSKRVEPSAMAKRRSCGRHSPGVRTTRSIFSALRPFTG